MRKCKKSYIQSEIILIKNSTLRNYLILLGSLIFYLLLEMREHTPLMRWMKICSFILPIPLLHFISEEYGLPGMRLLSWGWVVVLGCVVPTEIYFTFVEWYNVEELDGFGNEMETLGEGEMGESLADEVGRWEDFEIQNLANQTI